MMKIIKLYAIPLAAALLVTALFGMGALRQVDWRMQDALFQRPRVADGNRIVLISIDDETLDSFGPFGPSYRGVIAAALERLAQDPERLPAAVAVDILYTSEGDPAYDARLVAASAGLGCVITATTAEYGDRAILNDEGRVTGIERGAVVRYEEPFDDLRAVTTQGHINAMADRDGLLRHALLYVEPDGRRVYSMAYEAARKYADAHGLTLSEPPVDANGHYSVRFVGKPGAFNSDFSVSQLVMGELDPSVWDGKIVLIGSYAPALGDDYFTAISPGQKMYGVEFQANVIQYLLEGRFMAAVPDAAQQAALFILSAVLMHLFLRLKILRGLAVFGGTLIVGVGLQCLLYALGWITHPLWLILSVPILFIAAAGVHFFIAVRERRALALEKERIGAELSLATRIQSNALPKDFPPREEFDICASMKPAKEVGGDLYDTFLIDDDHLCLVIGDVSGKGVPASLFMMVAMTLIHHVATHEPDPGRILQMVNREICARNPEEMFVTVWLGVLEISTGRLTAVNAGHEYPAVKSPGGHFELLKDKHGFVVGGMEGVRYRPYEIAMEPGSKLFVYTDGVAEATDAAEKMFGTERMIETLRAAEDGEPREILARMDGAVSAFVGRAPQFDDLTMLCLCYHGPRRQTEASETETRDNLTDLTLDK